MAEWVVKDLAEKIAVALLVGTVDDQGLKLMPVVNLELCRAIAEEALRKASTVELVFEGQDK